MGKTLVRNRPHVQTTDGVVRMQAPPGRAMVVGALVWVVLCVAGGFVVVARLGDYGSVLQLLIGAAMGLFGAVSHILLSLIPRFRRLNFVQRGLLNWLSAYLSLVAYLALFVKTRLGWDEPGFWAEMAEPLLLYVGTPMLCLALLVAAITTGTRQQGT